jgi:hypothetical protein
MFIRVIHPRPKPVHATQEETISTADYIWHYASFNIYPWMLIIGLAAQMQAIMSSSQSILRSNATLEVLISKGTGT